MKKIFHIITVCCVLVAGAGCEKILEVKPESQITDDVYFKSEGDFDPYLTGIYKLVRGPITSSVTGLVTTLPMVPNEAKNWYRPLTRGSPLPGRKTSHPPRAPLIIAPGTG